ncbi:hypothetical protein PENTCL1PPCAC_259, partial [Pristionchus entomophagus]
SNLNVNLATISRKFHSRDFADPSEPHHDVALMIDGRRVYVSKQFLSIHSSFFQTMFYVRCFRYHKTRRSL